MREVILYDHDGTTPLFKVVIPIFQIPADGLTYGARFFTWNKELEKYTEGMCYNVGAENLRAAI